MIRISAGSAVGWAIGWDPANFTFFGLCQLKHVQDNIIYIIINACAFYIGFRYACLNCSGERPSAEDIYNHGFAGQSGCYAINSSRRT